MSEDVIDADRRISVRIDPEIVDRVALAIHEAFEEDFPKFTAQKWEALTPMAQASMRKRAIAAIRAYNEVVSLADDMEAVWGGWV